MINFITGKINSFKTTKILALYQETKNGDGFIMIKHMEHNNVKSYDLYRLSTDESFPFVIREEDITKDFKVACQIGPYVFNQDVLTLAALTFNELIEKKISPLFLDEVGLLELQNKGFSSILEDIVKSKLDAFIVVRSDLISKVIEKFQIKEYRVLS